MARTVRAVILGAPGSGKGTQAALVSERLGIPAISTGEMLREAVATGTGLGLRVEEILNSGALVDDETMAEVIRARLAEADAEDGFLLDGYPRNEGQAGTLAEILAESGEELDVVWFLAVPEEVLIQRALTRQRGEDDREEVVRKRLALYQELTDPLVGYYSGLGLVERIDGDQPIKDVTDAVMNAFEGRLASQGAAG